MTQGWTPSEDESRWLPAAFNWEKIHLLDSIGACEPGYGLRSGLEESSILLTLTVDSSHMLMEGPSIPLARDKETGHFSKQELSSISRRNGDLYPND